MEHSRPAAAVSGEFLRRFAARAGGSAGTGTLSFAEFMRLALYDPEIGYYRVPKARVGRATATDFYTSATFDEIFGELVVAAVTALLGADRAAACELVEIGAEPGRSLLAGVRHDFRAVRTLRVGELLTLRGDAVVFANELFDAQPFHRMVFRDGTWREIGVALTGEKLSLVELPAWSTVIAEVADRLPRATNEGYVLDLPLEAEILLADIARQPWQGLLLAFDYGRTWTQLTTEFPEGTARAYRGHRQSNALLADPGEQDLTCHVCWDWLEQVLRAAGFTSVARESQEAFFVRRAAGAIEQILTADRDPLSPARTQLKHLLHPSLMGQRFEALFGTRVNRR